MSQKKNKSNKLLSNNKLLRISLLLNSKNSRPSKSRKRVTRMILLMNIMMKRTMMNHINLSLQKRKILTKKMLVMMTMKNLQNKLKSKRSLHNKNQLHPLQISNLLPNKSKKKNKLMKMMMRKI